MKDKILLVWNHLKQGTLKKMWKQTLWIYQYGKRYWRSGDTVELRCFQYFQRNPELDTEPDHLYVPFYQCSRNRTLLRSYLCSVRTAWNTVQRIAFQAASSAYAG